MRSFLTLVMVLPIGAAVLPAQEWNSAAALDVVDRAVARRQAAQADSGLRDYRARAHGFVFFLAQLGEGLDEPPRLVKADELQLEVYWRAPGSSKQRIIGWRDRADLPTDIEYHRDHLGIVQNNFSNQIRLGAGEEVRDVPHPLSPEGRALYEFALGDAVVLRWLNREIRVRELRTRPRDFATPRVVGKLFIDVETADLVVFRFTFTRSAYLDGSLEDITIVLENGLWNGRYWLPRRQEVEIRRRTSWLDLPARGIIRGRWEIDGYEFNLGLGEEVFFGPEITAAPANVRDSFPWEESFDQTVRTAAGPIATFDLEAVRSSLNDVAGARALTGLARTRPSVGGLSDLAHYNRVEGLAVGAGWVFRPGSTWELRVGGAYGIGDETFKGWVDLTWSSARWTLGVHGSSRVADVGDEPVISPILNSIASQEIGRDYGDYYRSRRAVGSAALRLDGRSYARIESGVEWTGDLPVVAGSATGSFRPNAPLGSGAFGVARVTVGRRPITIGQRRQLSGTLSGEVGVADDREYGRVWANLRLQVPAGPTEFVARAVGGYGWGDLPPHRSFVFGGRGTLVGEEFRLWGGRRMTWLHTEWRLPVPFPAIPLGPLASTGRQLVLAPFVGAGWAGGSVPGVQWQPTGRMRPVVGIGAEWFHGLLRVDVGLRGIDPHVAFVFDVRRDLWGVL